MDTTNEVIKLEPKSREMAILESNLDCLKVQKNLQFLNESLKKVGAGEEDVPKILSALREGAQSTDDFNFDYAINYGPYINPKNVDVTKPKPSLTVTVNEGNGHDTLGDNSLEVNFVRGGDYLEITHVNWRNSSGGGLDHTEAIRTKLEPKQA